MAGDTLAHAFGGFEGKNMGVPLQNADIQILFRRGVDGITCALEPVQIKAPRSSWSGFEANN
jgi:hypothetical protein